jgi:4-carboxymuconolactone decarboxylase
MNQQQLKGLSKFEELNAEGSQKIKNLLADTAPDMYHQILEVVFGDLYQRTNLDPKIRQTVPLIALASANREIELRVHLGIAKSIGFTKKELVEVFSQLGPFAGFPSAMLGIRILKEVFPD